ncbi:MAG: LysR substrate-binding domain-containing protein [Alphaproteobacteria bacterium]|nr:LysR substrate-binding domain-containing protein [Alphaproteobacteria bacterium]
MDGLVGLRVFALVADLRSFSAAAERLGLSPAMVSKHVQAVEQRVGARLLNRTSRSVSLTEAGTLYLTTVRGLLDGLDQTEAQLSQTTLSPRGVLKVSLPVWMANPAFARLLAGYHARHPEVTLDLDLSGRMVNLVDEGFDLALRVTPTLDEALIARRLGTVLFILVGSPALLDRLGRPDRVEALAGAPFLAYSAIAADGRVRLGAGSTARELQLRPVLLSGNETLLHLAVREGIGLCVMPHWLIRDDLADGTLEAVLPRELWPAVTVHAVYPNRSYLPAKVRSFLDFLSGPHGILGAEDLKAG